MGFVCYLFVTQEDVHPYILVPVILLPCVLPMIVSVIFKHCVRGGKWTSLYFIYRKFRNHV